MTVKLAPIVNDTIFSPTDGLVAAGYQIFFYDENTTDKKDTYTTQSGAVANSNPITLDSYGRIPSAGQVWLTEGTTGYKIVLAPPLDTDPPASGVVLADYVHGINDFSGQSALNQWQASGLTPTYLTATSFSVTGDQTSDLHVGRRLMTTNTGGTIYSTITASVFTSVTTITVVNDSGTLDSGLSAVSYGILTSTNPSVPKVALPDGSTAATQTAGDNSTKIATTAYVDGISSSPSTNDFRLTLTSGTPVTTSDVTGATSVYATPMTGNAIALYDGSGWVVHTSAEMTLALGTLTSGNCYDVFCYDNSGTPTLESLAWTNSTTRATALVRQNGVLCKTGDLTRRYLGTFLTTSTTETADAEATRYLWNYYHRTERYMEKTDSTTSWTYTTAAWRQANGAAANQINMVVGVVEDLINVEVCATVSSATSGVECATGCGLNSTSTLSGLPANIQTTTAGSRSNNRENRLTPIEGYNYVAWLEYSVATGTTTWYGTTLPVRQNGITGTILG